MKRSSNTQMSIVIVVLRIQILVRDVVTPDDDGGAGLLRVLGDVVCKLAEASLLRALPDIVSRDAAAAAAASTRAIRAIAAHLGVAANPLEHCRARMLEADGRDDDEQAAAGDPAQGTC